MQKVVTISNLHVQIGRIIQKPNQSHTNRIMQIVPCKTAIIEKEITKIDKDGNGSVVTKSYKIKFIDSARFMATSLSNLVDNLTEEIHKSKCKDCDCFLEYESVRNINIYLAIKIIQTKLMKN